MVLLQHAICWRIAHIVLVFLPVWKFLVCTIIAVGVLFRTATKVTESKKLRASNTSPNVIDSKIPVSKTSVSPRRLRSSLPQNKCRTNSNETASRDSRFHDPKSKDMNYVTEIKPAIIPVQNKYREISKSQPETVKRQICGSRMECYPDIKPKFPINKSPTQPTRTTIMHSSVKNYKPQLEDIKSSYLLLENNVSDLISKTSINSGKWKTPLPRKPNPFDENTRKLQLLEVKKKFLSRQFCNDSKYDKIEGLNWISWK